jgi:hypothetical protein
MSSEWEDEEPPPGFEDVDLEEDLDDELDLEDDDGWADSDEY